MSGGWAGFCTCPYLSTSDSTVEEIVVQSSVYLTVSIHSFGNYQHRDEADGFWSLYLYIGLGIPPSLLDERDVGGLPTFLRIELDNIAGERIQETANGLLWSTLGRWVCGDQPRWPRGGDRTNLTR